MIDFKRARRISGATGLLVAVTAAAAPGAYAQAFAPAACVTDTLGLHVPPAWIGTSVGQVTVAREGLDLPVPGVRALVPLLHRTSGERMVRNELSVAPGSQIDTTELLESVRRLRRTRLFADVAVTGQRCAGDSLTSLRVATHDSWSLRAALSSGQGGSLTRVSLSEANLLGSGRMLQFAVDALADRSAISVGVTDPHLFDTRFLGSLAMRTLPDGRSWSASVRTREQSPRDKWRLAVSSYQLRRSGTSGAGSGVVTTAVTRRENLLSVERRFLEVQRAVYAVIAGAEDQNTDVLVERQGAHLGRAVERRRFVAPRLGLARRATTFGAIDWLVPGQRPAELPVGVESEITLAVGRDDYTAATLVHEQAWIGAVESLGTRAFLSANVWWSAYQRTGDPESNRSIRGDVALTMAARRGLWLARAAGEHIHNPDPDVFALSTADPALRVLASSRLAETAVVGSLERSLHLISRDGQWTLDGAVYASYSQRYRTVTAGSPTLGGASATVLGVGIRYYRRDPLQASTRIDIARAVHRSRGLPDRWILSVTTVPWVSIGPTRDQTRNPPP